MKFHVLGPVEVAGDDGTPLTLRSGRERVLLALLALSPGRVVSSERLAAEIWEGDPPEDFAHALQVHISRLRRTLRSAGADGMVVTRRPGYLLRVEPGAVDAVEFDTLAAHARELSRAGDHRRAAAFLRQALDLWRGPALADVPSVPLVRAEAARLEESRLAALEDRIEADLTCGRHHEVVAELEGLTRAHPLRERLWRQRMVALYRAGRQADALRAYAELRRHLGEELGLEPSASLADLEAAMLRHDPKLDLLAALPVNPRAAPPQEMAIPALLTETGRVFVGRQRELRQLDRCWTESRAGACRLVFISGEPGVGKTRLAAEVARRVQAAQSTVLAGRCDEDLGVPFQPFVEALRHFVVGTPAGALSDSLGRHAGELARIHPELTALIPDLAAPLRSDPATERYRLFDAVAGWLAASSAQCPVLLVLDDLQWATKPTLLLLRHLVRSPQPLRLLTLAIYRDTDLGPGHPLTETLADLRAHPGVEWISLSGLAEADVAAYLAETAVHGLDAEGSALARTIHAETEGNPFFVREIIRHLAEIGDIVHRDGRWQTGLRVGELVVPAGVRDVVARRLSRLSANANQTLRVAAVAGPEFELPVIREVAGLDEEAVLSAMEEAIAARLVVEQAPTGRHRFVHALVQGTIFSDLTAARRKALHRRVAEAIEGTHPGSDDHLSALAFHWARGAESAAEAARAAEWAVRAGDRALAQLAHDDAADHYAGALELLERSGTATSRRCVELLISQGEAQRRAGDPRYRQTLLDATERAREAGDADGLARAALANTRGHIWTGVFEVDTDRVDALEAAIAAVGEDGTAVRARLLATLGLELGWEPDPARRLALSAEALALARSLEEPATLAHVLLARDYTITAPDNAVERFAATTELLAIAEQLGDPVLASRTLSLRVKAALELADVNEAESSAARNRALVDDLGQPTLEWAARHHEATLLILHASPDAETAITAAGELAPPGLRDLFGAAHRISWRLEQGRGAELEGWAREISDRSQNPLMTALYAHILAETDRVKAAATIFDGFSRTGFAHPPNNAAWLAFATEAAWLCSRLGRADCVPEIRRRLEPYADQLVVSAFAGFVAGSVAHYLGLLCTTVGDRSSADRYFARAAAAHEGIRAPMWLARTRLEWGRMLLQSMEDDERERGEGLLDRAVTTAREFELAQIERQAVELA